MKILSILSLIVLSFSALAEDAKSTSVIDDKMTENINTVPLGYTYEEDFDSARFRLKAYKMTADQVVNKLNSSSTQICDYAKRSKDIFNSSKSSSEYVNNVLKSAGALNPNDKDYSMVSAHYVWDFYLAFRGFLEINTSFDGFEMEDALARLPDGVIIQLSKHCVPNGAVAIYCDKKFYTKRFPNLELFLERSRSAEYPKCKINKGIRFIVESKRLQ